MALNEKLYFSLTSNFLFSAALSIASLEPSPAASLGRELPPPPKVWPPEELLEGFFLFVGCNWCPCTSSWLSEPQQFPYEWVKSILSNSMKLNSRLESRQLPFSVFVNYIKLERVKKKDKKKRGTQSTKEIICYSGQHFWHGNSDCFKHALIVCLHCSFFF